MPAITNGTHDDRDHYMELIQKHPLRPIKNDFELQQASEMLDSLLDNCSLNCEEEDYLEVLTNLVEAYEKEHHAIPPLPDHELLQQLIYAKGVSQVELARSTGIVESTISAILSGKRKLNRSQIGLISRYFSVSPELFSFS